MIISYNWLKNFFDNNLPDVNKIADGLTMHSLEVEGIESKGDDQIFDVKVLPNLNHSCLCHRGIAKEVGAIFGLKVKKNSRELKDFQIFQTLKKLDVKIEDEKLCRRYIGRVVENVLVHESPDWLKERIEAIGQRSINNVVDATNFVMFEIGQPMHAFDADKLAKENILISVQKAKLGDHITTLDKKEVDLDENVLLITDGSNPLAIAGIKGGTYAELDENTKNIVLESASFDPVLVRKTSQRLRIQTDASKRYENDYAAEMAGEAMDVLTKVIVEIAGTPDTKVGEVFDNYPRRANKYKLGISSKEASSIIGVNITDKDIEEIFNKFGFEYEKVKPVEKVLEVANFLIGVPYKKGSSITYEAPNSFDCSGFALYCFSRAGVQIPRVSIDQFVFGKEISKGELIPGDMIFSNTGVGNIHYETINFLPGTKAEHGVDHVGIYIGDGKVIYTTELFGKVVVGDLDKAERFKNIVGYRRMTDGEERFVITVPDERLDLRIKEDLAEDIGRIYGYDKITNVALPNESVNAVVNKDFYYKEKVRRILYDLGFSEVINYSFRNSGEIELENPMSSERKYLRTNLTDGIKDSLEFNVRYNELVEMSQIKIFEFGHVFTKDGESQRLAIGVKNPLGVKKPKEADLLNEAGKAISEVLGVSLSKINKEENIAEYEWDKIMSEIDSDTKEYDFSEVGDKTKRFKKISQYPFMIRDIAVFTPEGTKSEEVFEIISKEAGDLMIKNRLFDVFTKKFEDGSSKTSYAYRLIFQSYERTLTDDEVNSIMQKITDKMNANNGWQVR
ncbi:MAG: phenylalanine--tRNA ligase beta subunit-related protein [Candidatus Paceibacterota bacterium]|jgi:phenylalanyl-tRNA synthetase beta subunit